MDPSRRSFRRSAHNSDGAVGLIIDETGWTKTNRIGGLAAKDNTFEATAGGAVFVAYAEDEVSIDVNVNNVVS